MNNLIKIAIFISILFILLPVLLSFSIRLIPANYQPSLDYPQKVFKTLILTQTFIAKEDNLTAIGVSIKNPQLFNKQDISLILKEGDNISRVVTLNGGSIKDGEFVKFMFVPIQESKNKKYTFQFTSPYSDREESLEIFITNQGIDGQQMFVDNEYRAGAVAAIDFYKPTTILTASVMVFEDMFARLLADAPFIIFYSLILFSLIGGIIFLTFKKDKNA